MTARGSGTKRARPVQEVELIVVSDLHLGDGDPRSENWRTPQQIAWERLLRTEDGTAHGIDLVINGDCFDLLQAGPPLENHDVTDAATSLAKLQRIVAAHLDWFAALRAFLQDPNHTVTFLIGNHDADLALAPLRALVRRTIGARAGAVRFCLAQAYLPCAGVAIEHGCQADPWNRVYGLWDHPGTAFATPATLEHDDPDDPARALPATLELPFGSRYSYRVYLPTLRRFPYFDAFLPALPQVGIIAMLCLYAPDLVASGVPRARTLFNRPDAAAPVPDFTGEILRDPARLYEAVLPFVAALQADVWARAGVTVDAADAAPMLEYIVGIQTGLAAGELDALRAIFAIPAAAPGSLPADDVVVAAGLFARNPDVRLALAGHTHAEGTHRLSRGSGSVRHFVNTGTWFNRMALPRPKDVDTKLAAWLRDPLGKPAPLAPATAFTFASVRHQKGRPPTATLGRMPVD